MVFRQFHQPGRSDAGLDRKHDGAVVQFLLPGQAFGHSGCVTGDVVDNPVDERPGGSVGVAADDGEAPGAGRRVAPLQRRRDVRAIGGVRAPERQARLVSVIPVASVGFMSTTFCL